MSYTVKKISGKRWDILKDQALLIPNFTVLTLANKTASVLASEVAGAATPILVPPPPVEPPSPVERTSADRILGPMLPAAAINALGSAPAKWLSNYREYEAKHWTATGANWEQGDYYDRAEIDYAMARITGEQVYHDHADAIALSYRGYVETAKYQVQPHWAQMKGLALHYLAAGDEASRKAVGQVADLYVGWAYYNMLSTGAIDGRIKGRTLETILLAREIAAPSLGTVGGFPGGNDWTAKARGALDKILAGQLPDGTYRSTWDQDFALDGSGPIIRAFMEGQVNGALIDYYFGLEKDPRIVASVKRNLDALWDIVWVPSGQAFRYNSKPCVGEGTGSDVPAPDLNGLIVGGFGFVYAVTGDPLYKQRGDEVFAGGVNNAYLDGQKQFNQNYTAAYNYLALTNHEITTVTGDRARDWLV